MQLLDDAPRRLAAASSGLLLILFTLFVVDCGGPGHVGWDEEDWGPLVPHRTFPGNCGLCHVPERWDVLREDFTFDHGKETGHALEGAHASAACLRCHNDRGPVAAYVARGCGGCHADPHSGSLGLNCERCHGPTTWRPTGLIAEHARTSFPLFGAHLAAPCERCHPRAPVGEFRGAPASCEHCHADDLARATAPDHAANGWTKNCERCHRPSTWSGAGFSHSFFPLTGGHSGVDCVACHTSGSFGPIPRDCVSCHSDDLTRATNPDHAANGWTSSCERCHTTTSWSSANFNHNFFPLTGGHGGLQCVRCHTSGTFGPIPSDCNSCHAQDYQGAPNHVALGYPTDCTRCHSTSSWDGAAINHSFPLRGAHNVSCATCHTGGNFNSFNCLGCHAHRQSAMDSAHQGRSGYSYTSSACYRCHPNGKGD